MNVIHRSASLTSDCCSTANHFRYGSHTSPLQQRARGVVWISFWPSEPTTWVRIPPSPLCSMMVDVHLLDGFSALLGYRVDYPSPITGRFDQGRILEQSQMVRQFRICDVCNPLQDARAEVGKRKGQEDLQSDRVRECLVSARYAFKCLIIGQQPCDSVQSSDLSDAMADRGREIDGILFCLAAAHFDFF